MSALAAAALLLAQAASPPPEDNADARAIFGWTAIGVGAAATVTGTVLGVITLSRYEDLSCDDDLCPPAQHDDARAYNDLRIPSGILTVGGVLVAGLGVPFVVLANQDDEAQAELYWGPGQLGLRGHF